MPTEGTILVVPAGCVILFESEDCFFGPLPCGRRPDVQLKDHNNDPQPIEDNLHYEGYQVENATEIKREDANLE